MAYKDYVRKIKGRKEAAIFLFALSTCVWCGKVKTLLNKLGVEYEYIDVDMLNSSDQKEIENKFKDYRTELAFPRTIINEKVIAGFDEPAIIKVIKNGTNRKRNK